ncbi:MAG: hypothetical protein WC690_07840, partial [bacterium]
GAVVYPAAGALGGCGSSSDEKKPDVTPPPPAKPQCDMFTKEPALGYMDQDSFDTGKLIWSSNLAAANLANWQPRTRVYLGAIEDLYRPTCEKRETYSQGPVGNLIKSAASFLGAHYAGNGDPTENGILVLIGGFAPTSIKQEDVFAAYNALAQEKPGQKDFAELMKAGFFFNKAADKADRRFTGPIASSKMSAQDRTDASENLKKMDELLNGVKVDNLNDRQREFLFVMKKVADAYRKTLIGGVTDPVDCKTNPNQPKCKGGGKTVQIPDPFT